MALRQRRLRIQVTFPTGARRALKALGMVLPCDPTPEGVQIALQRHMENLVRWGERLERFNQEEQDWDAAHQDPPVTVQVDEEDTEP